MFWFEEDQEETSLVVVAMPHTCLCSFNISLALPGIIISSASTDIKNLSAMWYLQTI